MTIDEQINSLIEALNRNTEALLSVSSAGNLAGASAPAPEKATKAKAKPEAKTEAKTEVAEKQADKPAEPKHSQDEVVAALLKIKDDFGIENAKPIIKTVGGVDKMADIPADKRDAVYDAAVAKHAELTAEATSGGDDDGM